MVASIAASAKSVKSGVDIASDMNVLLASVGVPVGDKFADGLVFDGVDFGVIGCSYDSSGYAFHVSLPALSGAVVSKVLSTWKSAGIDSKVSDWLHVGSDCVHLVGYVL